MEKKRGNGLERRDGKAERPERNLLGAEKERTRRNKTKSESTRALYSYGLQAVERETVKRNAKAWRDMISSMRC